jgi:hypothetical protein
MSGWEEKRNMFRETLESWRERARAIGSMIDAAAPADEQAIELSPEVVRAYSYDLTSRMNRC